MRRLSAFLALPVVVAFGFLSMACDGTVVSPEASELAPAFAVHGGHGRWVAQVVGATNGFDDVGLADRDINLLAIQAKLFADGSASGTIQGSRLLVQTAGFLGLGPTARFFKVHGTVSCMEVAGNRAWIGGVATKGEVDIGLAGLGPPPGTIVDVTGALFKFWLRDPGDGTIDVQVFFVDDLSTCTDQDEPPIPFFNTPSALKIMDRR